MYQLYAVAVYALLVVGAISILRTGTLEARKLLGLLFAITLTLAFLHALAYVEGRHRWGVEPLLLLLTARGVLVSASAIRGQGLAGSVAVLASRKRQIAHHNQGQ
jgi:hypothetical protein